MIDYNISDAIGVMNEIIAANPMLMTDVKNCGLA
jgi:hypothetical protein